MHPETEKLERLRHGELTPAQDASIRSHVEQCALCAGRLEESTAEEQAIFTLLRELDHPIPPPGVSSLIRRSTAGPPPLRRIAAGIALAAATAGALYAVPGSPLRDLFRSTPATESTPVQPEPYAPGVAVMPGPHMDVDFTVTQAGGVARVELVPESELSVRAIGGAVTFDVDIGRVAVHNDDTRADYDIAIPQDARSVSIRIGGAVVFRKEGSRITTATTPDADGSYRLPMSGLR